MSPLIDELYDGGEKVFYNDLLAKGLLNQTCQRCNKAKVNLFFWEERKIPTDVL